MTGITDKFQSFVIDRLMGACGVKQVKCLLYRKECIGWMRSHRGGAVYRKVICARN